MSLKAWPGAASLLGRHDGTLPEDLLETMEQNMSDNRITIGWVAELREPLGEDRYEEITEDLYHRGTGLSINYEGTLIYMTTFDGDLSDEFGMHILADEDVYRSDLLNAAIAQGFAVNFTTIRHFVDLWYDGADSTHSMMTLDEFRKAPAR